MHSKSVLPLLTLLIVASFTLTPMVAATPLPFDPVLSWSHNDSILKGSTITATFGLSCPPGSTFSGTLTVTEPDGVSVATVSVTNVPCAGFGTNVTAVYPTGFTGTAGTSELGAYKSQWTGVISISPSDHPGFDTGLGFFHVTLTTNYVPEFSAPTILIAAMGLVLLALMKKTKILKL
jgi:hypothetical protein